MTFLELQLPAFLAARGLREPDGRPLYAYRCETHELEEFQRQLTGRLGVREHVIEFGPVRRSSSIDPIASQVFCLWAAEWWRRNHEGGPWSWEALLATIRCEHLNTGEAGYGLLCESIASGLRSWKRELLRTGHGRAFLVTLACEGGLPLHLVKREGGSLRRYFRALLEEIRDSASSGLPADQVAEQVAGYLPRSLRHDVVYQLSGRLASEIWQLQGLVGTSATPVLDLDRLKPGWREELPLNVEDSIARALLNNLLTDASAIARMRSGRLRWTRKLLPSGAGWDLVGTLELPTTLRTREFQALFKPAEGEMPRRFDLSTRAEPGRLEVVAIGTEWKNEGAERYFRLEPTRAVMRAVRGADAVRGRVLVARDGRCQFETDQFTGSSALSDLPWIFEDDAGEADSDGCGFVCEGSAEIKGASALVVVAEGVTLQTREGTEAQPLGPLNGLQRQVFRLSGAATCRLPDEGTVVIRTGAAEGSTGREYRLRGAQMAVGRGSEALFRGMPRLLEVEEGTSPVRVPVHKLEWRADNSSLGWLPYSTGSLGAGRIPYIDHGEVRFTTRVRILPEEAEIHYLPETEPIRGAIELRGIRGREVTDVSLDSGPGVHLKRLPGERADDIRLYFHAELEPPASVRFRIEWTGQRSLSIDLPFPASGAGFRTADGQALPHGAAVASGALSGVRAVAMVPQRGCSFVVEGRYLGTDAVETGANRMWLRMSMMEVAGGHFEIDAGVAQAWITSRLNASNDPEGSVRLEIHSNEVTGLFQRSLNVSRYDLTLMVDREEGVVRLPAESLERLSPEEVEALRLEMFPLYLPDREPLALDRISNVTWLLPQIELGTGPRMVVGWQGDWCRAQPCVVYPRDDGEEAQEGLAGISPRELIRLLSQDISHPGWFVVDRLVEWTQHLPPVAFDLLRALAKNPDAMALAALRVPETEFDRFWNQMETLRYAWCLIPLASWDSAVETFVRCLEAQLSAAGAAAALLEPQKLISDALDRASRRVMSKLPCLGPVLGRAKARVLGLRLTGPENVILHKPFRALLLKERQQLFRESGVTTGDLRDLPGLEGIEKLRSRFPEEAELEPLWIRLGLGPGDKRFEIANAPVVAALASIAGVKLNKLQTFQLRGIRDMAPDWFDDTHRACFLYALGVVLSSRIKEAL